MLKSDLQTRYAHLDLERLLCAIVESRDVRRRHQFFLWTQGHLQMLLPHRVLLCGVPRSAGIGLAYDCFYNQPLAAEVLARLCHPHEGLAPMLVDAWSRQGSEPIAISRDDRGDSDITTSLRSCGLDHVLAHGIASPAADHVAQCFFAFLEMPRAPSTVEKDYVRFVAPSAFDAYFHALAGEVPIVAVLPSGEIDVDVTPRETEILEWIRDGKSNLEIAMILHISPLTVKNHVQNILRKLQASNRAQAVSRAISMRLLKPVRTRPGNEAEFFA